MIVSDTSVQSLKDFCEIESEREKNIYSLELANKQHDRRSIDHFKINEAVYTVTTERALDKRNNMLISNCGCGCGFSSFFHTQDLCCVTYT